jgi:hypothetical protein
MNSIELQWPGGVADRHKRKGLGCYLVETIAINDAIANNRDTLDSFKTYFTQLLVNARPSEIQGHHQAPSTLYPVGRIHPKVHLLI